MKQLACLFAFVLSWLAQDALAAANASVDRQQVYDGDTLTLTIQTDAGVQGAPDLSPLKQGFEVLDSSNFSSFSFVNGRQSSSAGWRIRLRPLRIGDLRIPSLDVGGVKTNPVIVHVAPVPPEVAKRNADRLFVETEVDSGGRPPYVQQQVRLTVRLFHRVRIRRGTLSEPQPDGDVVFERMGKERRYEAKRNGRRYQVLEREYAMFPLRSGELHIPSVVFNGQIEEPRPQRRSRPRSPAGSLFDRFFEEDPFNDDFFRDSPFGHKGKTITARSPGKTLKVLPRPNDYKGRDWLPAAGVDLLDSWTEKPPALRVGEPVTRVLTLRAKGLEGSQLPELDIAATGDYNVYPEQPATHNRVEGGWVLGEEQRAFAIVPTHSGKLVMPEVRIHWWDTQQNRERETVLPRWELQVAPGAGQSSPAMGKGPVAPGSPSSAAPVRSSQAEPAAVAGNPGLGPKGGYYWLAAIGLLLLALAVVGVLMRRGRQRVRQPVEQAENVPPKPAPTGIDSQQALRQLREACEAGEPRSIAAALLRLASLQWPDDPPLDLRTLAMRCPENADAFEALDRALYAGTKVNDQWSGLCEAYREGFGDTVHAAGDSPDQDDLAPLYPPSGR